MTRNLLSLAWLASGLARGASAWEHTTPSELETAVQGREAVVVAFVAPPEERSAAWETEWAAAVSMLGMPGLSIDCSQTDVCGRYGVSSYPSFQLFKAGEAQSTYIGPRRSSAIEAWAGRAQRPAVSDVAAEALDGFKSADDTVFLAYVGAGDHASRAALDEVAAEFRDEFTFGVSTDVSAREAEGVEPPALKCHRNLDGETRDFGGPFDVASLRTFVVEASRPLIAELTPRNHQRLLDRGWTMVYVFAAGEAERAELRQSLRKMARSYYDSLTMATVDPAEFPDLPAKLGLAGAALPAGAVHQLSRDRIYPYPRGAPVTSDALQKWGLDVWQGRIAPWSPHGAATPAPAHGEMPGRIRATPRVSIAKFPGLNIRINGRDEL